MYGVDTAHANRHAHNVTHELHHTTVGAMADEGEGQNDLAQPLFGDRQIEQDLVICSAGALLNKSEIGCQLPELA